MHVLVATDGELDSAAVVPLVKPLAGDGGRVTVMTVVEVPRRLLDELRSKYGEQEAARIDSDAEYVGMAGPASAPVGWPGDDAMIGRYLEDKRRELVDPMVKALADAGLSAEPVVAESEDITRTILEHADTLGAEVLCIGSHGRGRFEGLLGTTSTKLVRRSPIPLLVLRVGSTS